MRRREGWRTNPIAFFGSTVKPIALKAAFLLAVSIRLVMETAGTIERFSSY
jgi:hypothetical protein